MNLHPGIKGRMGSWDYFVVKMSMRELAESVKFAHDVYQNRTLDDALQRALNESRVRGQIVNYLKRHDDRFFASIVIAAMGGNPKWFPVQVSDDEGFLAGDPRLDSTFGVLRFDGTEDYYALDGQHRLAAIKELVSTSGSAASDAPDGFKDEEVSVVVLAPRAGEEPQDFMRRYRRLFGHLNRYAKSTDNVTNIIMDEDDAFAICTRRLLMDHSFFSASGRHDESPRVKTEKGKNLRRSDTYFTSLETLYQMNITLLNGRARRNKVQGWCGSSEGQEIRDFQLFRPSDECLETLYTELASYWDAILAELPVLESEPQNMRDHEADPESAETAGPDTADHLLFWPIGQELLAGLVRELLDQRLSPDEGKNPVSVSLGDALSGLSQLEWRLHESPWRYFLLTQDEKGWRIRSEERKELIQIAQSIQRWILGLDEHDEDGIAELEERWGSRLIPAQSDDDKARMWGQVVGQRSALVNAAAS